MVDELTTELPLNHVGGNLSVPLRNGNANDALFNTLEQEQKTFIDSDTSPPALNEGSWQRVHGGDGGEYSRLKKRTT